MKKRKLWKAISAALSAVLLATSVPSAAFAAVPAKTADVQTKAADENELKLWYDEKAPDSYDGWEKWSLPLGNSGIGASVFGGITQERIQLNEKSLWSGGPSASRTNYNGGNIETTNVNGVQTKMSEVVKQIQEAFASGNTSTEKLQAKHAISEMFFVSSGITSTPFLPRGQNSRCSLSPEYSRPSTVQKYLSGLLILIVSNLLRGCLSSNCFIS